MADNQHNSNKDQKDPIQDSGVLDHEANERYQRALKNWDTKLARLTNANQASERLGKDDFEIRINTRD